MPEIEACTGTLAPEYAERLPLMAGIRRHDAAGHSPEDAARIAAFEAPYGPDEIPPCRTAEASAPGPHGPIGVRVYLPEDFSGDVGPALVFLHGGAFLGGDLDLPEADQTCRYVATATGRPAISVDYRLATGGVHHPVPEDDVVAAYRWVRDGGAGLPVDPERVAIGGGSAGACLAASAALRMRDEGRPVWRTFLCYPLVHSVIPEPSPELAAALAQLPEEMQISPDGSRWINENYVGGPVTDAQPYAFPGDAHDLTGLGRTWIENCEFDGLRASGERYAEQLAEAGVEVEVSTAPGVPHAHLNWVGSPRALATCHEMAHRMEH